MWIKLGNDKYPILNIVDVATKFQAAVVYGEKTPDFKHALERGCFRHFGIPNELVTDEGRGWASDEMRVFVADPNIKHTIAPGEAHQRLGIVARRHAVLRKAIKIYMDDGKLSDVDDIRQAVQGTLETCGSELPPIR